MAHSAALPDRAARTGEIVHGVVRADAEHGDAAAGGDRHQALVGQLEQRLAHRRAAGAELPGDLVEIEAGARRQAAGEDAVPQLPGGRDRTVSPIRLKSDISDITLAEAGRRGAGRKGHVMAKRSMSLVGFMQAGSTTVYAGSWRHPATEHGFLTASYYAKLGRVLEEGCFDMMFFDDRLAMPGIYGGSVAEAVRLGARPVKLDLSIVLGVIAGVTEHIGLGATYSTTYYSPFHVARTFATLDHLTGGRAAWNVVTSVNDSEAQNYGFNEHLGHDERYDRADEFLEATTGLWDTWEDDALVLDRPSRHLRRPDQGPRARTTTGSGSAVRGPLTVPRSPQGRPVLLQAGSSGRGRDFAARWAELIFTGDPDIEIARAHYKDQKERIAAGGRDPRVGQDAADGLHGGRRVTRPCRRARAGVPERPGRPHGLADPAVRAHELRLLRAWPSTTPITDELIESVSGIRGLVQNLRTHIGDTSPWPTWPGTGPRCSRARASSAPATEVADQMEEWIEPRPATASSSPPPTPPAPTRTWSGWSCPSSSAAASSATATPAPRCATTSGLARPEAAVHA